MKKIIAVACITAVMGLALVACGNKTTSTASVVSTPVASAVESAVESKVESAVESKVESAVESKVESAVESAASVVASASVKK